MLRVIAIYDYYEEKHHQFDKAISFRTFEAMEKGINRYLPPFHASPDLRSLKYYAKDFYAREGFSEYVFENNKTGDKFPQHLLQMDFLLEINRKGESMGGDYRVRIDVVCNSLADVEKFNSSPMIDSISKRFGFNTVITRQFDPDCMPQIFKKISKTP